MDSGKVIKIENGAPKKEAPATQKKMTENDLFTLIRSSIDHGFGEISTFYVVANDKNRYPVITNGNQVNMTTPEDIGKRIIHLCQNDASWIAKGLDQLYDRKQATRAVEYWIDTTKKRVISESDIRAITFSGEDYYSWCVLPFDIDAPSIGTECPTWEEILGRMTQPQAFMDFIASIFLEDSDRSQYLWLYGDGGNGKSSITSVLQEVMGAAALSDIAKVNTWSASNWAGKRLIYFPDTNNYQFVTTGIFKAATGSDWMTVQAKYRDPVAVKPHAKFIFTSNTKPNIGMGESDQRRMILCELGKVAAKPMPSKTYHNLLMSELPNFVAACIEGYASKYRAGELIEVDRDIGRELAEENYGEMQADFDAVFEAGSDSFYLSPSEVNSAVRDLKLRGRDAREFKRWLESKFGAPASYRVAKYDNQPRKLYRGFRRKVFGTIAGS